MKRTYVIDGQNFSNLEEFFGEIGNILIPGVEWGENLDTFNDILRGGFGTPEQGFVIRWQNSDVSHERLGYPATVTELRRRLESCHPENPMMVAEKLKNAKSRIGPTVFDRVVHIIQDHGEDGSQTHDGVELVLE